MIKGSYDFNGGSLSQCSSASGNIVLICGVTSQDHLIEGSCEFMAGSSYLHGAFDLCSYRVTYAFQSKSILYRYLAGAISEV